MDDRRQDQPEDRRRAGERRRRDEISYVETKAKQDRFEELVREEQDEGDWHEQSFQDAVERDRAGEEPDDPPTSGKP